MQRKTLNPRTLAIIAAMTAIVFVLTRAIQVPTPAKGYTHLGDTGIVFASLAFGPWVGAVAGGLGTALSDATSGPYAAFAPASLVIHGAQGLVMGLLWSQWTAVTAWIGTRLAQRQQPRAQPQPTRRLATGSAFVLGIILCLVAGGLIVVAGYFLVELAFEGLGAAAGEVVPNILEVAIGGTAGALLFLAVRQAYPPIMRVGRRDS